MSSLTIDISTDGNETEVVLIGDLDLATTGQFLAAMEAATEHGRLAVTVDARRLAFCDSVGLRALLSAPSPGPLAVRASEQLERLLKMTETDQAFRLL